MDLVLITNIAEDSVTEVALVKPKPDFSPAPFILGSQIPLPLMSLLLASRECIMQVTSIHFQQIPPKKHTRLDFKCLIDSTMTINK